MTELEKAYERAKKLGVDKALVEEHKNLDAETLNLCLDIIEEHKTNSGRQLNEKM